MRRKRSRMSSRLPVLERDGNINRTKLGHFLSRNAKRIVTGHRFEKAHADGRVAWKVVRVDTPASGTEGGTTPGAADEGDSVF